MSMTNKELVLRTMRSHGKRTAEDLQNRASEMMGTELYEESGFIPSFIEVRKKKNMNQREAGFVCLSPKGRVVELITPYDSDAETREPEELLSLWRFKWSKNPKHALPFVALSTSPYGVDECCVGDDENVYASTIKDNIWSPTSQPQYWRKIEVTE